MPPRVAVYIRVSTTEQNEQGLSLDAQLESCLLHTRAKGYAPPFCLYLDGGISAGTIRKRPAMSALLQDVEAGRVQHIVATKLDRLWRNTADALTSLETIKRAGASLSILDLSIDTSTAAGEMVFSLMGAFAQFERKQTGQRVLAVNKHVTLSGRWIGPTPPYGYTYNPTTQLLEIHDAEAQVVREVFERYSREWGGAEKIVRHLNAEGRRRRDGGLWYAGAILYLLRNPVYRGEVIYGRGMAANRRWHERDDDPAWARAEGRHEPLIDREAWEQAARLLRSRATGDRPPVGRYLFSGLALCGYCGSREIIRPGAGGTRYYGCHQLFATRRRGCDEAVMVRTETLDEAVAAAVVANVGRVLPLLRKGRVPAPKRDAARTRQRDREHWERKRKNLVDLKYNGLVTEEEFEERAAEVRAGFAALERTEEPPPPAVTLDALETFADYVGSEEVAVEAKRTLLRELVSRVLVHRETVVIHYREWGLSGWLTEETLPRPATYNRSKARIIIEE